MSADISQSPVPTLSEDAWTLLHDLRLRGFRPAKGGPIEDELTAAGLVMLRGPNLALAPAGREAHAAWARLVPGSEEEGLAKATYERFLVFNVEFLRICTDWQLKPGNQPNDHSDSGYDFKVLERLDRLDERVAPIIEGLGKSVPRFAGYRGRRTEAPATRGDGRHPAAAPRCP